MQQLFYLKRLGTMSSNPDKPIAALLEVLLASRQEKDINDTKDDDTEDDDTEDNNSEDNDPKDIIICKP